MPNIKHIDEIISAIQAEEVLGKTVHFDMESWATDDLEDQYCGTAGCIAGFSAFLRGRQGEAGDVIKSESRIAMGLDMDTAEELFLADVSGCPLSLITSENAVQALEDVKSGSFSNWLDYVDWDGEELQ